MVRIVVDEKMRERLGGLDNPLELFDERGHSLGRFVPTREIFQPLPEDQCPHTAEELAVMRAETGGRSLAEIWKDLGRK